MNRQAANRLPDGMHRLEFMVPMRDGVRLATDVYLPGTSETAGGSDLPLILERTPYGKREPYRTERTAANPQPMDRAAIAAYFASHGYGVVYQDCRGRFASEGRFTKYLGEGPDGYDTLVWLLDQSFSNGRIGTMGLSYAAHTQMATACMNPPGLVCMLLDSGGFSNAYRGAIRQGGALELKQATWACKHARLSRLVGANPEIQQALDREDIHRWFKPERMPWRKGLSPLKLVPEYEDYLIEQWTRGRFGDYWRQIGLYAEGNYEQIPDIPVLHISSWYDPYARCATRNFRGLRNLGKGPNQLVLRPWIHGQRSETFAGDIDFGPAATLDDNLAANYLEFRRVWFDRWLKEDGKQVESKEPADDEFDFRNQPEPVVRYFLMGGGSGRRNVAGRLDHGGVWKTASDWPPPDSLELKLHLCADGTLRPTPPDSGAAPRSFRYDPMDPVPTIGGAVTSGAPIMEGGGFDQVEDGRFFGCRQPGRPLAERPDVLVFATPPLERDLEFAGTLEAELWVASDCPDTDFTVKLLDWYPPSEDYPRGFALNITDGILRLRYRNSWERPEPLVRDQPTRIRIQPFPAANRFLAGHRLRIDIASSNYPRFDLNPNTGEPEGLWTRTRVATNRVFVDREHPSLVRLDIAGDGDRNLCGPEPARDRLVG